MRHHHYSPEQITAIHQGARNYALADASDPFAYNRAVSHFTSGISSFRFDEKTGARTDAFYRATSATEMRKDDHGHEYPVTVYRDLQRP